LSGKFSSNPSKDNWWPYHGHCLPICRLYCGTKFRWSYSCPCVRLLCAPFLLPGWYLYRRVHIVIIWILFFHSRKIMLLMKECSSMTVVDECDSKVAGSCDYFSVWGLSMIPISSPVLCSKSIPVGAN